MTKNAHEVLLYYCYTTIADPEACRQWQWDLCQQLDLKGRIIIAAEGINATVEGSVENISSYIAEMLKDPRFVDIDFKRSQGTGEAFPKLSVKARSEIVSAHLGEADINPAHFTAPYLTADELHAWLTEGKEFYIVDMRNDYEHKVGHFETSILPPLENFRDLPAALPQLEHLRDKTVLTVCTGGVRCEKASGFLLKHGFQDVYQLYGGIVSYMEKYPNQAFKGALYVFDGRITMGFNTDSPDYEMVGRCERCNQPSEHYVNCDNLSCHKHFICCTECIAKDGSAVCSQECLEVLANKELVGAVKR